MINKILPSPEEAVADVPDGATVMFAGFGSAGSPTNLILALHKRGVRDLTVIANNIGLGDQLHLLVEARQVKKVICSFPFRATSGKRPAMEQQYLAGEIEIELNPQGTLVERIRAGGAGVAAFYTPTGVGTVVAEGKEVRTFNGREYVLETGLTADYAFIRGRRADRLGNLAYRMSARNFAPSMAMAARVTIAEVEEIVEVGELEPERIHTPGIFVHRLVQGERHEIWWFN